MKIIIVTTNPKSAGVKYLSLMVPNAEVVVENKRLTKIERFIKRMERITHPTIILEDDIFLSKNFLKVARKVIEDTGGHLVVKFSAIRHREFNKSEKWMIEDGFKFPLMNIDTAAMYVPSYQAMRFVEMYKIIISSELPITWRKEIIKTEAYGEIFGYYLHATEQRMYTTCNPSLVGRRVLNTNEYSRGFDYEKAIKEYKDLMGVKKIVDENKYKERYQHWMLEGEV